MNIAGWKRSMAIQIAVTCSVLGSPVFADESSAGPTMNNAGAEASTATSEARTEATSPTTPPANAKPDAVSTPTLVTGIDEVAPGPLFEQRKSVLSKIMAAKSSGIGVTGYLSAFTFMEGMVRGGKPASAIQERLQSITHAIDEQMKRADVLKTQHPTAPTASQSGPAVSSAARSGGLGGLGGLGGIDANTINQLKQKYGDKIPASLSDIPPDKLLNSDQGKEMLKKFLNK